MKTISFSATEVLPALLNGSKKQTIRPAWKICGECFGTKNTCADNDNPTTCDDCDDDGFIEKPQRFGIGDSAKLFWQQRSQSKKFCKICGMKTIHKNHLYIQPRKKRYIACVDNNNQKPDENWFNKFLRTTKVTEVFKISIGLYPKIYNQSAYFGIAPLDNCPYKAKHNDIYLNNEDDEDLAKRDGFDSYTSFLKYFGRYFDDNYDREQVKPFWVTRW